MPAVRPGEQAPVTAVADAVRDLIRSVRKSKARMTGGREDVESATQAVLHEIAAGGPMRASALAGCVHSDLSTVSRQATALVADGLLERQADPVDGRASLLALTSAGQAAVAAHETGRAAFFARVLDGWADDDLRQFASYLLRFTAAYDAVHAAWLSERRGHAAHAAGTAPPPAAASQQPEN